MKKILVFFQDLPTPQWYGFNIFNGILMSLPTCPSNFGFQSSIINLPLASRMQPSHIHLVGDNWNLVSRCSSGNCLASHLVLYSERLHFLHHMLLYDGFLLLNKNIIISWCRKEVNTHCKRFRWTKHNVQRKSKHKLNWITDLLGFSGWPLRLS